MDPRATARDTRDKEDHLSKREQAMNDNYVVGESDRLLTYRVPETAEVTILTTSGSGPLYQTQSSSPSSTGS
jgi:hypothetical protein